jgi:glycosyltransferase involved in cell wall biosynthesis
MREADAHFYNLESPAEGVALPTGRHLLRGWLVPKPGQHFADVRARIGETIFGGVHGFPRADLAAHFQTGRKYALAEFSIEIPLAPGPVVVVLEALDISGRWQPFHTAHFTVTTEAGLPALERPPLQTHEFIRAFDLALKGEPERAEEIVAEIPWPRSARDAHEPFHGFLDEPASLSGALYGRLHILGWLFHAEQPVKRVFATADLLTLQPLELGGDFAGVRERFPQFANAANSRIFGFADIPAQLPRPLCIRVYAELANGSLHLCLAVWCRPTTTEELKAAYATRGTGAFRAAWRALDDALRARSIPAVRGWPLWPKIFALWKRHRTHTADTSTPSSRSGAPLASQSDATRASRPQKASAPAAESWGRGALAPVKSALLVTHNLNYEGAPLFLLEYARALAKANPGARLSVLSLREGALRAEFAATGATVIVSERAEASWREFDLVVANTLACHAAVTSAHRAGRATLLYIHESTTPAFFYRDCPAELPAAHAALVQATRVSFLTESTRRYYDGIGDGSNYVINPGWIDLRGVATHRKANPREAVRAKLGLKPDELLVANVGTVCDRKGQHVFLRALELLAQRDPALAGRCRFVMVGGRDTPYNALLRDELAELGRSNIEIVNETAHAFDFYGAADLFVCTSYEESFPRVVLEAMAFGLPILASGVHGIPEMVQDGREAMLVPPGDTAALASGLGRLLGSPAEAARLGAAARARVEREFGIETVMPRHLALASGLAGGRA